MNCFLHHHCRLVLLACVLFSLSACQPAIKSQGDPDTRLLKACVQGNYEQAKSAIEDGANVNVVTPKGVRPIFITVENGYTKIVALLIQHKVQLGDTVTFLGYSPLERAATKGHGDIVALLLKAGVNVNYVDTKRHGTALVWAAFRGNPDVVAQLLAAGAEVNHRGLDGETALWLASAQGHSRVVEQLLRAGADPNIMQVYGITPLMQAARFGSLASVKQLVQAGANIYRSDVNGRAAVNYARDVKPKKNDHSLIVRFLVKQGADVNGMNRKLDTDLLEAAYKKNLDRIKRLVGQGADVNARDKRGFTVLMHAASYSATSFYLIDRGADIRALNRGKASTLHDAATRGNLRLVKRLVAAGLDVNRKNGNNETPLCEAVQTQQLRTVTFLLENGADPNIRSRFGTPLQLAIERNNNALIALLKQHGAI